MDQKESHIRTDIEGTRTAMTEKIEMIEDRMHETVEGTQSTIDNVIDNIRPTIDNVMDNIKRVQGTVEDAKSTVDNIMETIKYTMDETIERVKYTTDLIEQVNQNPWIMFGSAMLIGYVLSSMNQGGASDARHAQQPKKDDSEPVRPTSSSSFSTAP
jgi:phage-related protein